MLTMGEINVGPPMPQIASVIPCDKLNLKVTWKEGLRRGKTDTVDLSPLISSFKLYKPLLKASAFAKARVEDDGQTVVWDHGIDMAAMSIERLAEECMDAAQFRAFVKTLDLTQVQAAALLGYSRRQVAHYLAGTKAIPRIVSLACRRLLDTRSDNKEFVLSWSSEHDALSALLTCAPTLIELRPREPHVTHNLQLVGWQMTRSEPRHGT